MKRIVMLTVLTVGLASWALSAQAPPATEVYLAPLTVTAEDVTVGAAMNISNNPGYDNQPSFLPDSSGVLFASNRDGKQNDIYRWTIASKSLMQLTKTAENEYSPLVAPDGKSFICVHGTEQSLFRYDLDGANPRLSYQHGTLLIGYHVWLSDVDVATFILGVGGGPNSLQLINTKTGAAETIAQNIGRSLLRRPKHNTVSFVTKASASASSIKEFDVTTHAVKTLIYDTMRPSEDLTWLPDGNRLIMGSGSKLAMWTEGLGWRDIADLGPNGVTKITRLAASPDGKWLAVVGEPAK